MKYQFEKALESERSKVQELTEGTQEVEHSKEEVKVQAQNQLTQSSKNGYRPSEEEQKDTKETEELTDSSWREKWCKDGVWLKWVVERLDDQDKKDRYHELKQRIHEKHGHTEVTESTMLRFLHGQEYDVDVAEEKIVGHVAFMNENNYWDVEESRIPNMVNLNVLWVHKQDIYERPIAYLRIGRFYPGEYEFEEIRNYMFWNAWNIRKAFKPHIESHIAIYDVKGLSRKNFSMAFVKKAIPDLENNLPELWARMYVVRPSFLLNMLWKAIKPFLHKLTLDKIKFLTDKEMSASLLQVIPPENLPVEYGGEDTEFDEKFP